MAVATAFYRLNTIVIERVLSFGAARQRQGGEGVGQRQREAIAAAIGEVMNAEEGTMLCCTIEARNAPGDEVAVQVMQDSINISPYAHEDDPLERLASCGATAGLDDADLEVVDWEAGKYATLGVGDVAPANVALLVDQVFTRLLGCDDAAYAPSASTEDLG